MELVDLVLPPPQRIKVQTVAPGQLLYYRDLIDGEHRFVFLRRENDAMVDFSKLARPELYVACTHFGFIQFDADGSERSRTFSAERTRPAFIDRNFSVTPIDALPAMADPETDPTAQFENIGRRALRKLTEEEIEALSRLFSRDATGR